MKTIDVLKAIDRHIEECPKEELACIYNDLINPDTYLEASDILDFDEMPTT